MEVLEKFFGQLWIIPDYPEPLLHDSCLVVLFGSGEIS
jgi:hypothetical protein